MSPTATPPSPSAERLWHPRLWAVLALILATPLVAMQFSSEFNWGLEDVLALLALLVAAGLLIEIAFRRVPAKGLRTVMVGAVVLGALIVWAELAVGLW